MHRLLPFLALILILPACVVREVPPYEGAEQPSKDETGNYKGKTRIDPSKIFFNFNNGIALALEDGSDGKSNLKKITESGALEEASAGVGVFFHRFKIAPNNDVIGLIPQGFRSTEFDVGTGELCSLVRISYLGGNASCIDSSGHPVSWKDDNAFGAQNNGSVQFDEFGNVFYVVQREMGGFHKGKIQSILRKATPDGRVIDIYKAHAIIDDFVVLEDGNIFISGLGDISVANSWFKRLAPGTNLNEKGIIISTKIGEGAPRYMKLVDDPMGSGEKTLLVGMTGEPFGSRLDDALNWIIGLAALAAEGYVRYQTGGAMGLGDLGSMLGGFGSGSAVPGMSFGSSPLSQIVQSPETGDIFGVGNNPDSPILGLLPDPDGDPTGVTGDEALPVTGGLIIKGSKIDNHRELTFWHNTMGFKQKILAEQNLDIQDSVYDWESDRMLFRGLDRETGEAVLGEVDLDSFVATVSDSSANKLKDMEFFNAGANGGLY